jgi:hypothetical protein
MAANRTEAATGWLDSGGYTERNWSALPPRIARTTADPKTGGVSRVLCDDESAGISGLGVDREGFVGDEIGIGGDGEFEFAVDVIEVLKADVA